MAIEDGAALGVLLSSIRTKDEIPARLQLFQQMRIDRVSAMVIFSSVGQDESARIADIARPYVKGPMPGKSLICQQKVTDDRFFGEYALTIDSYRKSRRLPHP